MESNNILNHSYWEKKHIYCKYDLIVIGSGIVGLSAAISFKEKNKQLESNKISQGAVYLKGSNLNEMM